jgi:hypothetical protein
MGPTHSQSQRLAGMALLTLLSLARPSSATSVDAFQSGWAAY